MDKQMMIDIRLGDGYFARFVIDENEFCVRDGVVYFITKGEKKSFPVEDISQVFMA